MLPNSKITTFLDSKIYSGIGILLILSSLSIWVIDGLYSDLASEHKDFIEVLDMLIIIIFSIEFILRTLPSASRNKYLLSFNGSVDFLSIAPSLIELLIGSGFTTTWLRVLKISRLIRLLKIKSYSNHINGIVGQVLPFVAVALLFKCGVLVLETNAWWEIDSSINMLLGVSGFSIAILLGSKLSTVNSRLYALEDSVCRVVGAMRDMWSIKEVRPELTKWSTNLEDFLVSSREEKLNSADSMRTETDKLEELFEEVGVGGPNSAGFHRDVAFLIHRATALTPPAYDHFLKYITLTYCVILIVAIPGVVGLVSAGLTSFVIGGIYLLIADMDDPLSYEGDSFIDARLDALQYWNSSKINQIEQA